MMRGWDELRRDCVVFEDEAILVLNKPVGISVMGERHETDLTRMAEEAGERLFPVHRIDKVTSGVVVFAKDLAAHGGLTRQFNKQTVEKTYLAVVSPAGLPEHGTIDLPLSVGRKNRVRVGAPRESILADLTGGTWTVPPDRVFDHVKTYPSVTTFSTTQQDERFARLRLRPLSGRRHQLRVHLAWIGHPILHDPLFARPVEGERTYLHSWRLSFDAAWRDGERMTVEAAPDEEFRADVEIGGTPFV